MAKPDCSELARMITDIAMSYSAETDVKNLNDVVTLMKKDNPLMTRQMVVDSIVEATEGSARQTDAIIKNINAIKREARKDKGLQRKIKELEGYLETGKLPTKAVKIKDDIVILEEMRATRDKLNKWLKNSDPAASKRLIKKLESLKKKLASGDISVQKKKKTEFREPIKKLQEQVNAISKQISDARAIGKVEKQIDTLQKHLDEGTAPASEIKPKPVVLPQMQLVRDIRDDLKRQISQSDPARQERVKKQIKELERRIKEGDILPKQKPIETPKTKQLERQEFERDQLQSQIRRQIAELKPKSIWGYPVALADFSREMMLSYDLGAVFRQGGFFLLGKPVVSRKAFPAMIQATKSEQGLHKLDKEMNDHPLMPLFQRSGGFIAPSDGTYRPSQMEEAHRSAFAKKFPGIRMSERAYVSFLNKMRIDVFGSLVETMTKGGEATKGEAEALANFVNVATGRGNLGRFSAAADLLALPFLAPRYVASRFQLLLGQPLFRKDSGRARKLIAKEYAKYMIGVAIIAALLKLAGEMFDKETSIEINPKSSDFGKFKIGNTRIDLMSGISQPTVLLTRLISGEYKSTTSGKVIPLRGDEAPPFGMDIPDVLKNFFRYKLSPLTSFPLDVISGENAIGEKVTPQSLFVNSLIPLSMREIKDSIEEQGVPTGLAISFASILGASVQTYGSKIRKLSTVEIRADIRKHTYKKDSYVYRGRKKVNGKYVGGKKVRVRAGQPHKNKEFLVDSLRKELLKRKG